MWLGLKLQENEDWYRAHLATDIIHVNTAYTKTIFAHMENIPLTTAPLWKELKDTNMR